MKFRTTIISVIAICLLSFVSVHAFGLGIDLKGGVNVTNIYEGKDGHNIIMNETSMQFAPVFGLGVGFDIARLFVIQPEFFISVKGCKHGDWSRKLGYFEMVLPLFKLRIPTESFIPNFYAGPALGLLYKAEDTKTSGITEHVNELDSLYKKLDFGVVIGGGADIKVGEGGRVIMEARYTIGILNTMEPKKLLNNQEDEQTGKNHVISVMVGFGLDFGSRKK
jgi:hypothetical protein